MSFYTYMLRCADGSYYIGHTDDIEQRMTHHRTGKFEGYTSARLPVELVWMVTVKSRNEAFVLERQIKGWSRKKKEALITDDWQKICELSKNRQQDS